jgi:hypothetical protein
VQAYNAQAAVEPVLQLIVGQALTQAANDKEQIEPMVEVMSKQNVLHKPKFRIDAKLVN